MQKWVKIALLLLIGILIILQFFQPERNLGTEVPDRSLLTALAVPDSVADILKKSCFDCHSNHTDYPWYSRISPVSWYLNMHIIKGKTALNFDDFGNLEGSRKIGALGDICDMVEARSMPLKSYLLIHRNARIGKHDMDAICSWSESEALRILREGTSQSGSGNHQ